MSEIRKYTVDARRWERGWELHVKGVGVTQARRLNEAEAMARDYVAIMTNAADDDVIDIEIVPHVGDDLDRAVAEAREATREAAAAQGAAATMTRAAVRELKDQGLKNREIAIILGVSQGRVAQLVPGAA